MVESRQNLAKPPQPPVFTHATAPGTGGITMLLIDGRGLTAPLDRLLQAKRPLRELQPGELTLARLHDLSGRLIDEVVVSVLGAQSSETGNPQAELSAHGGLGVLAAIEQALTEAGIFRARGTELLERAHLNGKLSLIALEAQMRLPRAATARQAEFLLRHTAFQQRWERHGFDMAMGLRTNNGTWRARMLEAIEPELARAACAQRLLRCHSVALCGPVNAGKSTLANALARSDRHIVSEIPGTTLDRLEAPIALRGLHVLLSDTAGLRDAADEIESEGQRRGLDAARSAALRVLVLDGSRAPGEAETACLAGLAQCGPFILVLNKTDAGLDETARGAGFLPGCKPLAIAARSGQGLSELESEIEAELLGRPGAQVLSETDANGSAFTARQTGLLRRMQEVLRENREGAEAVLLLCRLTGTRPDPDQLAAALSEK